MNRIIRSKSYRSYLEIGCYRDDTFKNVVLDDKTGVDPERGGTLRMTSDAFFAVCVRKFDLIFVDGLHHYDQALRDVENSLQCLSPGGLIVLDDCRPQDEQMQCVPRRSNQPVWTGDVWKAMAELVSRPDLSCVSVPTSWIGVGLVRPVSSHRSPPLVKGSDLTWRDYAGRKATLLNEISIDEFHAIYPETP